MTNTRTQRAYTTGPVETADPLAQNKLNDLLGRIYTRANDIIVATEVMNRLLVGEMPQPAQDEKPPANGLIEYCSVIEDMLDHALELVQKNLNACG